MNKKLYLSRTYLILFFILAYSFLCCYAIAEESNENNSLIRSDLLTIVTSTKGNTIRYDYVDDAGNIIYAVDKQYATRIQTNNNGSILEEYYDADGLPSRQKLGHYALLKEYNEKDQIKKLVYLDINGQPMINYDGYAIVERYYNDEGLLETEFYFDNMEKPITTRSFGNGCKRIYDDNGNTITYVYLDNVGKPAKTAKGYAIIHRTYYTEGENKGKIKEEYYCDENDNPVKLINCQYGIYKEYDEYGRVNKIIYLGIDGESIINADGYAICKRTFYDDDSIHTETYYDEKGNPVALLEGQYGVLYQDNKTIYLDINGCELFSLKNTLQNNHFVMSILCTVTIIISLFSGKKTNIILLAIYLLLVFYLTMMFRNHLDRKMELRIFWSYKMLFSNEQIRWQIIENIFLFIPFGIMLYVIYPKPKVLLFVFGLSIVIELLQYIFSVGLCEIDDVISNSLGGYLGYLLGKLPSLLKKRINFRGNIHIA